MSNIYKTEINFREVELLQARWNGQDNLEGMERDPNVKVQEEDDIILAINVMMNGLYQIIKKTIIL